MSTGKHNYRFCVGGKKSTSISLMERQKEELECLTMIGKCIRVETPEGKGKR